MIFKKDLVAQFAKAFQVAARSRNIAAPGLNNFFAPSRADTAAGFALNQQGQLANQASQADIFGGILSGLFGLGAAQIGRPRKP